MSQAEWRVAAASVAGTSHAKTAQPCQDAHEWRVLPGGALVAAVADGAGFGGMRRSGRRAGGPRGGRRARLGDAGARCRHGRRRARRGLAYPLTAAFRLALAAVEAEAVGRSLAPRDLASTLSPRVRAAAFRRRRADWRRRAVAADGAGALVALTRPGSGEFINETTFLVSPGALDKVQLAVRRGEVAHLALFSDGLQMLALHFADASRTRRFLRRCFDLRRVRQTRARPRSH